MHSIYNTLFLTSNSIFSSGKELIKLYKNFAGTGAATTPSRSDHNHNTTYLGITAKASDSDKLDNYDSSSFPRKAETATITGNWTHSGTFELSTLQITNLSAKTTETNILYIASNGIVASGTTINAANNGLTKHHLIMAIN